MAEPGLGCDEDVAAGRGRGRGRGHGHGHGRACDEHLAGPASAWSPRVRLTIRRVFRPVAAWTPPGREAHTRGAEGFLAVGHVGGRASAVPVPVPRWARWRATYESLFCVLLPVVMCGVSSILGMLCVVEVVGNEENQCRTPSWRICARAVAPLSAGRGRDESEPRRACRQHQLSAGERGQRARNAANANAPRRAGGRPYRVLILRCSGMVVLHGDDLFTVPDSSSAPDTRPSPHDTAGA